MTPLYIISGILIVALAAFVWFGRDVLRQHPIRIIALVTVAAMGVFLGWSEVGLTDTLSSPAWCAKALQAERISNQSFGGLTACVDLLKIQLQALADNSKIVIGSFSFGMVVLVVIVLAGGKANATLPGGIGGSFGPAGEAGEAADAVAGAAVDKAGDIKAAAGEGLTPGPAMPEPK